MRSTLPVPRKPPVRPTPAEIFQRLSRDGHRITSSRRAVIQALHAAGGAVTVRELHEALGRDADLVTVYRTLGWLAELRVARKLATGGGAERFELTGEGEHTHHLCCRGCGRVFTVPACPLDAAVFNRIRREHGFHVSDHAVTFHGTCADCSTA
ncbi:MAG TPA: Fur family transcriptional regulator [Longimicrobium sp.]|nr:Fur family transcriptional regulator [Longimicrobium sp.]